MVAQLTLASITGTSNAQALLTVAVSSRALLNMERENGIFEEQGPAAFNDYMIQHEGDTLEPGVAFGLVRKLLDLNFDGVNRVEVVLLSRNSPYAGVRVMRSLREYGLPIERAAFCQGSDRFRYAAALKADVFLSANSPDVQLAVRNGLAAATMLPGAFAPQGTGDDKGVRWAMDGDSVLFDDRSDQLFREVGLARWRQHELENAHIPLGAGPFKNLALKLHQTKQSLPEECRSLLRLALITARGAPAHERALLTLRSWGIEVDEAIFAAGREKGPILAAFQADVHLDDGAVHVESATRHKIVAGLVPYPAATT